MSKKLQFSAQVPGTLHGERLDQAAAILFPDYSRSRLQGWIKQGELRRDGQICRPRDKVQEGDQLTLEAELVVSVGWQPEAARINLIYEDDSILVLNKPAGLVVHPAAGHSEGTLVNALLSHAPELAQLPRAGIVHRLDKDTSGLLVVARTLAAHHGLVEQLQARSVSREYFAICVGVLTGGGSIDAPIGRHPKQRKKMAVVAAGGKAAITHFRIERRFGHHTGIRVKLETGRTHQIRVHMAHRHFPLVGDPVYGGRPRIPAGASQALIDALRAFRRQALHARALGLVHPESGQDMRFECDLPEDLGGLLAVLGREDPRREDDQTLY